MAETFAGWVQLMIDTHYAGVAGRLAEAIGVTLTTLSRGMEMGTLGADTLLRLAIVTGRDASEVLTLAGKSDWAQLISRCYGKPRTLAPEARTLMELIETDPRILSVVLPMAQAVQGVLPVKAPDGPRQPGSPAVKADTRRARASADRKAR